MAKRSAIAVLDQERIFNIDELFFSITDKKGIIEQGNSVFTRVSGYTVDEIIGAPHSILRHPDMPRVIFKMLWDTIQAGGTIAAYVKNLAKDGRYYWVLAVAMPTERGYLSIRLKPTSPIFPIVRSIYGELLTTERLIETDPKRRPEAMAASAERLKKLLASHGFRDYATFMQTALSTEMSARHKLVPADWHQARATSRHSSGDYAQAERMRIIAHRFADLDDNLQNLFQYLDEFRAMNVMLLDKSHSMLENAATIRLLSLNATVAANQLGARAHTLGVVAESLGEASVISEQVIVEMARDMNKLVDSLSSLIFEVAAIKLQSEVSNHFLQEMQDCDETSGDVIESLCTLVREVSNRTSLVYEQLTSSELAFAVLRKRVEQLLRNVQTLRFVQFAGLKESVSLAGADAFAVVFEEAKLQIDRTRSECEQLAERVEASQKHIRTIRNARSEVLGLTAAMTGWTETLPSLSRLT